jgi:hypothetical protein
MVNGQEERLGGLAKCEVLRALSTPIVDTGYDFDPLDVWMASETGLGVRVRVNDRRRHVQETWEVTLPVEPEEWPTLTHWPTLHLIYRVLLEDWWATKEREEYTRSMGHRVEEEAQP